MAYSIYLSVLIIWMKILSEFSSFAVSMMNPLKGQHLRVIWPRWKGNPPGLAGSLTGGEMIDYLSARFKFTYEMVRVTENTMEPSARGKGFVSYLLDGQCDFLMADVVATNRRLTMVDFTLPWVSDVVAFLIPVSDDTANINAVIKPFQWPVWLSLGSSIVCVFLVLSKLQQLYNTNNKYPSLLRLGYAVKQSAPTWERRQMNNSRVVKNSTRGGNHFLYVLGQLLSQGGPCSETRLSFRIIAGVWTLAAFVLVQAYQSTLFTYVMVPISSPLIQSVYDLADSTDINFIVRGGGTLEYFFKSSNKTVYQKVQTRIDASPRCNITSDCISKITRGSRNVYADAKSYLKDYIEEEFKRSGKCDLQVARDGFLVMSLSYALPKNSPYTNTMSIGVLEVQQTGIIRFWDLKTKPSQSLCTLYNQPKSHQQALTLKNMTGAFVVLFVGLALSLLAFLYEKVTYFIACYYNTY